MKAYLKILIISLLLVFSLSFAAGYRYDRPPAYDRSQTYDNPQSYGKPATLDGPPSKTPIESPYVCETKSYNFSGQTMVLNVDRKENDQQLYFIQNTSEQTIMIDHQPTKASAGASAGWSSQLQKSSWSALALNEKEVEFRCLRQKSGLDAKVVPCTCKYVLNVCRATNPTFGKGTVGSYWVIENQPTIKALMEQVQQRGIALNQ